MIQGCTGPRLNRQQRGRRFGFAGLWLLGAVSMGSGCQPASEKSVSRVGPVSEVDSATARRTARRMAPPHSRPVVEIGGRTYLWAGGESWGEDADWFDMTDAPVDPRKFQYGIGKDTIPAIDEPVFLEPDDPRLSERRIDDQTVVIGYAAGGEAKAYPISAMVRHELVNDTVGGKPVTVGW